MSKIVYLVDQPFDERNYERFGVQLWIDRGWSVELWDLTPWVNAPMWRVFGESGRELRRFPGYHAIASARELARRRRAAGAVGYFIDLTSDRWRTLRARLSLARAGAVRVTCALGSMPAPDPIHGRGIAGRVRRAVALGPMGTLTAVRDIMFARAAALLAAPKWSVIAGSRSGDAAGAGRGTIRGHNFDYDIYLRLRCGTGAAAGRYAVFVDQDYCFHPEFTCEPSTTVITPQKYFPTICNGLRLISAALSVQVRIAAHPRATYRQRAQDYFAGFPVEYDQTAELIRDASVVVCHDSTAVQFAVLFQKPVIFVTTDELLPCYEGRSIVKVAAELGKVPINLDDRNLSSVDWRGQLDVDVRKYASYRSRYIKTDGSPEAPVWTIVINQIEETCG
jgi:hypothetical protein